MRCPIDRQECPGIKPNCHQVCRDYVVADYINHREPAPPVFDKIEPQTPAPRTSGFHVFFEEFTPVDSQGCDFSFRELFTTCPPPYDQDKETSG